MEFQSEEGIQLAALNVSIQKRSSQAFNVEAPREKYSRSIVPLMLREIDGILRVVASHG